MNICKYPDCGRRVYGHGWCQMHYTRVRKHGDPDTRLRNRGSGSTEENFWAQVEKGDECWIWTGHLYSNGYGQSWVQETKTGALAHRLAWQLTRGTIPDGMQLDHTCWNRACVNPGHLRLATSKQNSENLSGLKRNNTTGYRGVRLEKRTGRYYARVHHNGKEHSGGTHATAEEAHAAAQALRLRLFTHNDLDRHTQRYEGENSITTTQN